MTLTRYDAARDENEVVIVEALRRGGASVHRISAPGVPDLLVGIVGRSGRGETHLVEVKRPLGPRGGMSGRKLTSAQMTFREGWNGSDVEILSSPAEAADWIKRKRKRR